MTSEWQRVRELFDAALDLDAAERATLLDKSCGDDEALRAQVEELLAADAEATDDLAIEQPLPGDVVEQDLTEAITGREIGGYEIQRVLGSGGMSTVFLTVQDNPRREVALKTMRAGMFSPEARRRFEFESDILGRLRHPCIAQVFEAGTWREPLAGQEVPFFALEYVKDAVPFDRFVRERDLELRAALALFCEVCDAVSYGHQIGVIHRDLKPANVLVDPEGHPKIIDFGIARATESDIQGLTMQTRTGHVMGTLRYMAPEQLDGLRDEIDTRIDVYALGVMLYETLAGKPILDPGTMSLTAFAERTRDLDPPLPSRSTAGFGTSGVPRDLDWVTLKAVASDKNERYASVSELAADLRRFLADEPVSVGSPTAAYHVRKFVRRNKALVGGIALAFVILIAGIITTTWQWFRAEDSARTAQREVVKARTINDFFNDLLKFADPAEGRYRSRHDWTVRDALDAAADLFPKLAHEPEAEAQARISIGNAYKSLGQLEKAEENLRRAVGLRLQELGPDHPDLADAMLSLGAVLQGSQEYDDALEQFVAARRILERAYGEEDPRVAMSVLNVGTSYYRKEQFEDAEREIGRAIRIYRSQDPVQPRFLALSLPFLGNIAARRKDYPKAIGYWREAIAMYEAAKKSWHPYAAFVHRSIARELPKTSEPDRFDDIERHLRRALEIEEGAWGPESKQVRDMLNTLAGFYTSQKRLDDIVATRQRLIAVEAKLQGPESREVGLAHYRLATVFTSKNDQVRAGGQYRKAIAILDDASEKFPWDPIAIRARLAGSLRVRGKLEEAEATARKGYVMGVALGGETHARMRTIALELAKCLREAKRFDEAEKILRQRVAIETKGEQALHLFLARTDLAIVLGRNSKLDEARTEFAALLAIDPKKNKLPAWTRAQVLRAHGVFLGSISEHAAGAKQLRAAIESFDSSFGKQHPNAMLSRKNLAELLEAWGKPSEAAKVRAELR